MARVLLVDDDRNLREVVGFMLREAMAISGVSGPSPLQNSFMPPPLPVDSTTGATASGCLP